MGYYNKINPSNKNNFYTPVDGCGGTYEDKYYVNGMYIDLCGLSVKDYMNNPCCCNGNNNNGGDDDTGSTKPVNEILVKTFADEGGTIYYQAFAKYSVASTIKVLVSSTPENVTELVINAGELNSKAEQGDILNVIGVTLNINEDESYRYVIILEIEKDAYEIYYNAILLSNVNVFDENFKQSSIEPNETNDIEFVIPGTDFNYNDLEDMNEIEKFFNENQYCFVIYIPKEVYDKNYYKISVYDGADVTEKFVYHNNVNIDNEKYVCVVEKATEGNVEAYVPLYQEDLTFNYKITIND